MAELPLTGEYQKDNLKLLAFMVFPNDESLRDAFMTVGTPSVFLTMLKPKRNNAMEKGHVAGSVLYFLAMLDSENQASLLKAKWIVEKDLEQAKTLDGKSVVSSHQSINKAWKDYLPVAHLWAAHRFLIGKYRVTRQNNDPAINENEKDFIEFIATANWLSKFLLNYVPQHSQNKTPLVQENQLHIIPLSVYPKILEHPVFEVIDLEIKDLLATEYTHRRKYVIQK